MKIFLLITYFRIKKTIRLCNFSLTLRKNKLIERSTLWMYFKKTVV